PSLRSRPPPPASRRFPYTTLFRSLGVARLLWVRTRFTEGRPPPAAKSKAWAEAALEQSRGAWLMDIGQCALSDLDPIGLVVADPDRKSTRLNSSHVKISYAVFCLK